MCEIHPIAFNFESQKRESKWQQAFTGTFSVGFPRTLSRVVSRKRIVDFTEQRCPVLDRPQGDPQGDPQGNPGQADGQAPLGKAQDSAIMEKHLPRRPWERDCCWRVLGFTEQRYRGHHRDIKCDVGAANENADMASCSVA